MARKRKISELPLCTDFHGLRTIGTDKDNRSVAVSLDYIQETVEGMNEATTNANNAAKSANDAAETANKAAERADTSREQIEANEATRQTNEQNRQKAEAARVENEQTRQTNENARKAAETARVKAENDRATEHAALKKTAEAANEIIGQASEAVESVQDIVEQCRQVIASASQVESLGLIPTAISVDYPETITLGKSGDRYITTKFTPSHVIPNVLYLGDDKAVSVAPDGRITVNGIGESVIHVVPTNKTSLYQTIHIMVKRAGIRLVNSRKVMRFTSGGNIRFN